MKIEEFSLRWYGPLKDTGRISLGNFSLIFGNNEEGKTLAIDALTKILLGKNARIFKRIDRVGKEPDGFVILRDHENKKIKLPEKGNLTDLTGINPADARNIFIIRDSDLSIAQEASEESEHLRNITDRLTGMKTEEIEAIKDSLLERGKLEPTRKGFRNIREEKLRDRMDEAENLISTIEKLGKRMKEENFDKLENRLSGFSGEIKNINQKLNQYEMAENRERYEKGFKALSTLKAAMKRIEELKVFNEEDEEVWRTYKQVLKAEKERKKKLNKELLTVKNKLETKTNEYREENREFEVLSKTEEKIYDQIKPDMKNYEMRAGELEKKRGQRGLFLKGFGVSALFFLASLAGLIINPAELLFQVFSILFLVMTFGFGLKWYLLNREESWMRGMWERIKMDASKLNLRGESPTEVLSGIKKFEDEYEAKSKKLEDLAGDVKSLSNQVRKIAEQDIPESERKIRDAEEKIEEIKSRSKTGDLTAYREKIKELRDEEKSRDTQGEVLTTLFGGEGENLSENISYWEAEVKRLEEYKEKAVQVEHNEKEEDKLRSQKEKILSDKEAIENKIQYFREDLKEVERRANNVFVTESDFLHCETSVDLEAVKRKLEEFRDVNEKTRENVLAAIDIFDEIENEEEQKVSSLFGKDSSISKYFKEITSGYYTEVNFVPEERKIYVRKRNGEVLEAEKLSGGAYDQLYLSIRLGLGEKVLLGKKGFFIMDDPFVKADKKRLKQQIKVLKEICSSGWQVLYFTAKDEVKDLLEEDMKSQTVSYIKAPGLQ